MSVPTAAPPWPILPRGESEVVASLLERGVSVLLVGEAGVGKSQLATTAVESRKGLGRGGRQAAARGPRQRVVRLSGASLTPDLPLEEVSPVLRGLLRDEDDVATDTGTLGVPLLRVEDAHLLDHRHAHTLAGLARQGQAQLLITLHSTGASQSPWLQLWKDEIAERVDIAPLDAASVEELLTVALGGPLTTATCVRIMDRSQGNPFYLRELVRAELEAGTLVERRGIWVGLADAPPGPRVIDMVRHELDRLDPPVREALDLVALAGELPVSRLSGLVHEGAVDELVRLGLVVTGQSRPERGLVPVVEVRHPMYGEAVRELVPPDRCRRLYGAVRGTLSLPSGPHPGGPAALLRMVLWALECGVRESPDRLLAAIRAGLETARWDMAIQVAVAALDVVGPADPRRADALLLRAAAWYELQRSGEAARDLAEATATLARCGAPIDPGLQVRLVDQLADLDQFQDDDPDRALERIASAQDDVTCSGPEHARALEISRLARLGHAGRFAESLGPSLVMLAAAAPDASDVGRLVAPTVYGLGQAGQLDEADMIATRYVRRAMAHRDPLQPSVVEDITVAEALVMLWAGDLDGVAELLGESPEHPLRYSTHEVFAQVGRGMLAAARGLWSEARHHLESASARYSVRDINGVGKWVAAGEALAVAATGDAPAARSALERMREMPMGISATLESDLKLLQLDAEAWLGEPTRRSEALALARWSAERGLHRTELEALHRAVVADRAEPADPTDAQREAEPTAGEVLARILALGEQVRGPRPDALVHHARAVLAEDDELTQIGLRELGRAGLWLPPQGSPRVPLTRREREIASLAAGGLSSKAIAERFTLSVRTVDSHLSRVFTKLGVRSRRELAAALRG
ncbi:helix-turn-helix transcriptional regulator [Georgenia ruanii]|nr:LuxR family transcriptional regulator [Georgenia ruanii]MPV87310.1 hypothetical protein [Georgenia ruanii]